MRVKQVGIIDGYEVREASLESNTSSVSILSFGAITKNWSVSVGGSIIPILLGFKSLEAYQEDKNFMGIIAGRVANRVRNGTFKLNNIVYQLPVNAHPNHLHGGNFGFGKKNWSLEIDSKNCAVKMARVSPHLEEGYPGLVDITVIISLSGNILSYEMTAIPDRPTPINMAQHNYYNLMGSGNVWEHKIESKATAYTPVDTDLIPTGIIADLNTYRLNNGESQWNLNTKKAFKRLDKEQIGIDINLVLPSNDNINSSIAKVTAENGVVLEVYSNQPGLQFYTGKNLSSAHVGHSGQNYGPYDGFCLEPQKFPSSLTIPSFPSIIVSPERPYKQVTIVKLSTSN